MNTITARYTENLTVPPETVRHRVENAELYAIRDWVQSKEGALGLGEAIDAFTNGAGLCAVGFGLAAAVTAGTGGAGAPSLAAVGGACTGATVAGGAAQVVHGVAPEDRGQVIDGSINVTGGFFGSFATFIGDAASLGDDAFHVVNKVVIYSDDVTSAGEAAGTGVGAIAIAANASVPSSRPCTALETTC